MSGRAPGLVDALAHLDDPRINEPVHAVLARAAAAGVAHVVTAGTDPLRPDPPAARDYMNDDGDRVRLWHAFGVHPMAAGERAGDKLARLEERTLAPGVVAIGECGLDGRPGMPPLDVQAPVFARQLALARERGLPVILHVVHATARALELLRAARPLPGGYWHGFTGAPEVALGVARDLDLCVSFGGQVTNPKARRCRESARALPADRLLTESDTPDHYPGPPGDGRRSEPAHVVRIGRALAELRDAGADELMARTAANARRVLGLPE